MIVANLFSDENLEGVFSHEGTIYCSHLEFNLDKIESLLELDEKFWRARIQNVKANREVFQAKILEFFKLQQK